MPTEFGTLKLDFLDKLKEWQGYQLFEPERLEKWIEHLNACGIKADIDWIPTEVKELSGIGFPSLGRILFHDAAIDYVEIIKGTYHTESRRGSRRIRKITYEQHFFVNVPERIIDPPKAKRKPKRSLWLIGKVRGYRWHGKRFAERLAGDGKLNNALDQAGEQKIKIHYDGKKNRVIIKRPYIGMIERFGSSGFGGRQPIYKLPALEVLQAYNRIAKHIRKYVGA